MSEGNIRISKVLRELNISLERAVDYLKDKGIAIVANPNTKISDDVYGILCNQFAGDKGNKEASKGVSEEIKKEKDNIEGEKKFTKIYQKTKDKRLIVLDGRYPWPDYVSTNSKILFIIIQNSFLIKKHSKYLKF